MPAELSTRLLDAIDDGELVTVVYAGGRSPGFKRRLLVRRVAGGVVYAKDHDSPVIKTFRLDLLSLASDNDDTPWRIPPPVKKRRRRLRADPEQYFADWHFEVPKYFWRALGVTLGEYVDKEKTELAMMRSGLVGKEARRRLTVRVLAYSVAAAPEFEFHEGDVLRSRRTGDALQVVSIRDLVEVHWLDESKNRRAYQITVEEFVDWLKSGATPHHAQVGSRTSYSELLRFLIREPG